MKLSSHPHALAFVFRAAALALVVAAPWLPARMRPSNERSVVFVIDRSASIDDDAMVDAHAFLERAFSRAGAPALGVVAFDGDAELLAPVGTMVAPELSRTEGSTRWASDLAAALRLARAALPTSGERSIVVLSDVRPTRGDAAAEVRAAAADGVRVDVVPPREPPPDARARDEAHATVRSVTARALHVAEGQPVTLDVEVAVERHALVTWKRDGVALRPQPVYSRSDGSSTLKVELTDSSPPPGPHVYEVSVTSTGRYGASHTTGGDPDGPPPAMTAVDVEGTSQVVVFSGTGAVPSVLSAALKEAGLAAHALPIERAADPSSYSGADLVVLADVRVSGADADDTALTKPAQSALVEFVKEGGGLLVTGGVFGLAPEYAGTPLARILPVEIEDRGHVEDPPVALAIMLDRSGSMGMQVGTHTKIELAIEASLAAADSLRPTDDVAIASVDTETHWDVPAGPASRLAGHRDEVRAVRAGGGGIYVYTALKDAYRELDGSKRPVRHVILFSDTADSEEQSEGSPGGYFDGEMPRGVAGKTAEALAHDARVRGITTTVVGIGEESAKDTEFLRRLATAAGGRFYLTAEGTDLRRIFLSETRVLAQSNLRSDASHVHVVQADPIVTGVDVPKLPALKGYVETGRRSGADTALALDDGRPFVASWRYGLGRVAAITTDLTEGWGAEWAASSAAAQLLRQTGRHVLRQASATRADTDVRVRDRSVEVTFELPPDAPADAAPRDVELYAVDRAGKSRKLDAHLEAAGPGRFVARARSAGEAVVVARARDVRGALIGEGLGRQDRVSELSGAGPDEAAGRELARLGDGAYGVSVDESFRPTFRRAPTLVATWPWALVAAAVLVVVDLALRRRPGRARRRAAFA